MSYLRGLAAALIGLALGFFPKCAVQAARLDNKPGRVVTGRLVEDRLPRASAGAALLAGNRSSSGGPEVTANPDVHVEDAEEYEGGKRWNIEGPEGGSDKSVKWRRNKGGGTATWLGAVSFIFFIGCMPLASYFNGTKITKTHLCESLLLYVWLLGGLYLFTHVIIFQSPHFEHPRSLSAEEAVYLYAQILTTVGYGDITPARPRGQLCVGLFVLTAVLLIASMIQDMLDFFEAQMEGTMDSGSDDSDPPERSPRTEQHALRKAFEPVIYSSIVFCCFVAVGAAFFTLYPGEDKTPAQGVYMSLITLSTVGFGAFTPSTHAGMVVGAYWMIFGCSALMAVVTSRAAFSIALRHHELRHLERWGELRGKLKTAALARAVTGAVGRTGSKGRAMSTDMLFGSRRNAGTHSWGPSPAGSKNPSAR